MKLLGLKAGEDALGLVAEEVDQSVRPYAHVADAAEHILEEPLLLHYFRTVELQAHEHLVAKRTDEEVALPAGKTIAGIESHARGRDRRHPVVDRLFHARLGGAFADFGAAAVVGPVRNPRPAVVGAGPDDVHFVAALRAVLVRPQHAGLRMQCRALLIAMAQVEFLGLPSRLA